MKTTWLKSVVFMFACASCAEQAPRDVPDATLDAGVAADAGVSRRLSKLASAEAPVDLVVDDARVYFTSCAADGGKGEVLSVPLDGGAATTLATGASCPTSLARDADWIYATGLSPKQIVKVPVTGGAPSRVASSAEVPIGLVVNAIGVYWSTQAGSLLRASFATGKVDTLASKQSSMTRPVLDATHVYWGAPTGGTISALPLDGGALAIVTRVDTVTALAVIDADAYFASGYTLMHAPLGGGVARAISTAAGAPVVAVAADADSVYFTSYGSVWKVARRGGDQAQPVVLATEQGEPNALAVDATSLYWTNGSGAAPGAGGAVMKLTPK